MITYKKLALQGGGAKGVIHIGVAEALEKLKLLADIDEISGASAGAISALLLAPNWPVEKVKQRFLGLDFEKMATGGLWGSFKSFWRLITSKITGNKDYGFHDGSAFYDLFKEIVKEVTGNENASFEEWHQFKLAHPELGLKDISFQACNLNTKLNETFAHNTRNRGVPIAKAARASMGFPVFFDPVEINGCLYSDGGLQKNCPSDVFEKKPGEYNPEVLSIKLESFDQIKYFDKGITPPPIPINSALECAVAQFESSLNAQEYMFQQSLYKQAAVYCDTINVGTLDFNLTEDQKEALQASGEYGIIRYFYKHDPKIVEKCYDKETLKQLKAADFPICFSEFIKKQSVPPEIAEATKPEEATVRRSSRNSTPLYHHWCRNKALRAEHTRLSELETQVKKKLA